MTHARAFIPITSVVAPISKYKRHTANMTDPVSNPRSARRRVIVTSGRSPRWITVGKMAGSVFVGFRNACVGEGPEDGAFAVEKLNTDDSGDLGMLWLVLAKRVPKGLLW